jgi:hypothetical protein
MKDKVQNKINKVLELAGSPIKTSGKNGAIGRRTNDSLLKVIRNSQEATVFLAELNAAIEISQQKKD